MSSRWKYYQRLAQLYRSHRRRQAIVSAPPLRLWIEISSRCNLRCAVCPNKDLPAAQKGDMEWSLFQSIVDQGREFALEINLHHRGETLLHPEAGRFIRYAAATGIPCRLHTNATLLGGELGEEILDSGLRRLSVSFDGFSAETYESNRIGASFEQVTANIAAFLEARRRRGRDHPKLAIEAMDLPSLADKKARRAFGARFRKLGLDELVVKKPHNWGGYLGSPPASELPPDGFSACTFPWNALLVLFDGVVLSCSQDFFARQPLGSALEKPLLDIWNGLPMQELRRAFAERRTAALPACAGCDRIRRPLLGGVPAEYLRKLLLRRMP